MRRSIPLLLLALCSGFLPGCIDISTHYFIRKDGRSGIRYDIVMDKTMMQLMTAFEGFKNSGLDTTAMDQATMKLDKESVKRFRTDYFAREIARLESTPGVRRVTSHDSLAYDGVHMILECEFDSYRSLALLHSKDTTKSKLSFSFGDSLTFTEQGDSVQFMIADLSMLGGSDAFKDLDFLKQTEGWFKKTSRHLPERATSLYHTALWHATVDTPRVFEPSDSVQIDPDILENAEEGTASDSSSNKLAMLGKVMKMMNLFFSMEVSVESPLITSYGANTEFDAATHQATWHIDLSTMMSGIMGGSTSDMKYYVWFKKP